MKSNRGSISIFMLLIVPVLAIGIFLLYDYLNAYKSNNQVIKNTRNISEIQLSNNNAHLFENYGVLAYLDQDIIETQTITLNEQVTVLNLKVKHYDLGVQSNFMEATKLASRNIIALEAVNQIKTVISPMLKTEISKEIIGHIKKFEKSVEVFFDFHDEVKKIRNLMSSQNAESILRSVENDINGKLNETLKSYEVLLESEMEVISDQIHKYENMVNESIRKSEEWADRIDELRTLNGEISELKQEVKLIKSDIAQLIIKLESLPESDSERNTLNEKISTLKIQKSISSRELTILEQEWDKSIKRIVEENDNSKPMLLDKIAHLSNRIDEMLFDLDPIEDLSLPANDFEIGEDDTNNHAELNSIDGLIYAEYWMGVLKSFDRGSIRNFDPLGVKSEREGVIKGEVEFLVAGKLSDPQNIHNIKMRIFGLRVIANMIHIASDASKTSQISRTTTALPAPWNLVAHGALVTLWSSAEGYLDMISLFNGEGHHLIKKDEEWRLSFDQLMLGNIVSESKLKISKDVKVSKGMLFYQDYLRLMLYVQSTDITAKRAMFLLDANLNNVSNNRFNLNQFSIGHEIELSYNLKGLEDSRSVLSIVNKY
ncbi:MAG: DUF5702 domain-containing protein [Clostridiales bacterium]|nr:DUF5702 domain-containing protein [Clostridiales bacterium]